MEQNSQHGNATIFDQLSDALLGYGERGGDTNNA
jgi:hypothetical protein